MRGFKECPRCKKRKMNPVEVLNALSRKDNKTYICNDCDTKEAFEEYMNYKQESQ